MKLKTKAKFISFFVMAYALVMNDNMGVQKPDMSGFC